MAHSILLVVEKPNLSIRENNETWNNWQKKTILANAAKQETNLQVLSENVVLLTIDGALPKIGAILACLDDMDYKYALFDRDIEWVEAKKDSQ